MVYLLQTSLLSRLFGFTVAVTFNMNKSWPSVMVTILRRLQYSTFFNRWFPKDSLRASYHRNRKWMIYYTGQDVFFVTSWPWISCSCSAASGWQKIYGISSYLICLCLLYTAGHTPTRREPKLVIPVLYPCRVLVGTEEGKTMYSADAIDWDVDVQAKASEHFNLPTSKFSWRQSSSRANSSGNYWKNLDVGRVGETFNIITFTGTMYELFSWSKRIISTA